MNTELVLALLALCCLVALVVSAPLSRGAALAAEAEADDRRAELEAAKQAKYREIADARLDFKLGKVSVADHEATERELQSQAVQILHDLDEVR
jgi:predicted outer membrane protein